MTKFASRTDGAESLGPTGGPKVTSPAAAPIAANGPFTDAVEAHAIPDHPGAEKGLLGVKAPFGWRQTDDIEDRLRAAGVPSPYANDKI